MTSTTTHILATGGAALLLLTACSTAETLRERADDVEKLADGITELDEALSEEVDSALDEQSEQQHAGDHSDDAGLTVDVELNESAYFQGLEYEFGRLATVEPHGASALGTDLTVEVTVTNEWSETYMPQAPASLRWDEPGTGNTIEVSGRAELRQVPGGSSASGEYVFQVSEQDAELFDEDSARLVLGESGSATSQVPVGSEAELIPRLPIVQAELADDVLELGPVNVIVDQVEVKWSHGTPDQPQVPEGQAAVVVSYTLNNTGDDQACAARGAGDTFSLISSDGAGFPDLRVSERCVGGGQSVESTTGFTIDEPFDGDYSLTMRLPVGFDEYDDAVDLTLVGDDAGDEDA